MWFRRVKEKPADRHARQIKPATPPLPICRSLKRVEIENRPDQYDQREDNDGRPYEFVDDDNDGDIKLLAQFVYEPRQAVPP